MRTKRTLINDLADRVNSFSNGLALNVQPLRCSTIEKLDSRTLRTLRRERTRAIGVSTRAPSRVAAARALRLQTSDGAAI